jgi:hypothetical protein
VLVELRLGVQSGARVVEIDVPAEVEAGELGPPETRERLERRGGLARSSRRV